MRRRLVLLFSLVAIASSCGTTADTVPTTEPSAADPDATAVTVSTSMTTTTTSTTTPSTTTTSTEPPPTTVPGSLPNILRPDGLGPVDFGTPADQAIDLLVGLFGPADRTEDQPTDCYASVEMVQWVTWDRWGLRLVFTDWGGSWEAPAGPLAFADWEIWEPTLWTPDGLGPGMTVADLRRRHPEALIGINEYAPSLAIDTPWGWYLGGFDWPYEAMDAALQEALEERGFPTTGEPGAGTGQVLLDFMEAQGLTDATTVLAALGLPPDHVRVGYLHAGRGPLCD